MSIQRVTPDDFETFTIETNPRRTYISSSADGVTGSLYLFARRSTYQKEPYPLNYYTKSYFSDYDLNQLRLNAITTSTGSTDITAEIIAYMTGVQETPISPKQYQRLEIIRFEPPFRFNSNTLRKLVTINTLMPYYRTSYPTAHYNYTNYHSLNFFSSSNTPTGSVLLYPNPIGDNKNYRDYSYSDSFSFDFWIKPKPIYTNETAYRPGTLMHMSSAFAISLCSGSARDINGKISGFKLLLQLSGAADMAPDLATASSQYTFFSDDNALEVNKWHHVTIRWGGPNYNFGSGSFIVDSINKGNFAITTSLNAGSASLKQDILCIGNYYQGTNAGPSNQTSWFFSTNPSLKYGIHELTSSTDRDVPTAYSFSYPLKAEIHELKLYNNYLNTNEIKALDTFGVTSITTNLKFYLPPFFTQESPYRQVVNDDGGVLLTPLIAEDGTTIDPFDVKMAFGCGGHYINLENYVRDFATGRYPRLLNLTASTITTTLATATEANTLLYSTGSNLKRLYSILPNDNGNFFPNYGLLTGLSGSKFTDDLNNYVPGAISLRNMLTGSFPGQVLQSYNQDNSISVELQGINNPDVFWKSGTKPGSDYAIYDRTRDDTSNQVVFFDISNMYYGMSIKPGTFVITDSNISGSISGSVAMTIKDDGYGNLYRADASGSHATWASIGNIFYNEGIALIKTPQLYFFGLNQFQCEFQGIQNIHVLSVNGYARPMQEISSSYIQFQNGEIDDLANETDKKYVFISNVLLHDDNLNVIGRTSIAQPVLKRSGDKFLFKIKMDY